jgi:hypothetical protein
MLHQKQTALLIVLSAALIFLAIPRTQTSAHSDSPPQAAPDATRLKTGTFTYRDLDHGIAAGKSKGQIELLKNSGNFRFSADIAGQFSQQWESIATRNFVPVSAKLSFGEGAATKPSFELHYDSGRVTGFRFPRNAPATKLSVDATIPAGTIDQRIDWAAVLATDFETIHDFEFQVYDPGIGISHAVAHVGPVEKVQVPAGSFDIRRITYTIVKSTGPETYQVFASVGPNHVMVREDFQNGATIELTAIDPSE